MNRITFYRRFDLVPRSSADRLGMRCGLTLRHLLTLILLVSLLGGPSAGSAQAPATEVPFEAGTPGRTGEMPGPGPAGEVTVKWQIAPGLGSIAASPVIASGTLFAGTTGVTADGAQDGVFLAVDVETGQERWRFVTTGEIIWASAAYSDGMVFVASGRYLDPHGTMRALDAVTGNVIWTFETASMIAGSPVVHEGLIYFGSDAVNPWFGEGGSLFAVDISSGKLRWERSVAGNHRSPPVVDGNTIYQATDGGYLYARDPASGQIKWQSAIGGGIHWPAAAANGLVFVDVFETGNLLAIDTTTGQERWRISSGGLPPASRGVAVSAGVVHLFYPGAIVALDAATGVELWRADADPGASSTLVIASGRLYYGTYGGDMVAFDTATHAEVWRYQVGRIEGSSPAILDGVVYACNANGEITALWTAVS